MRRRSISIGILLVLTAGFVEATAPPASALTSVESCFFSAINRERASVGRQRLQLEDALTSIARRHSRRMAGDGTIYHNKNLGNEIPGSWYAAGENVGMGPSCAAIHDAFMSSPGHRANIIDRDYNRGGVGVAFDEDGTVYVTEVFVGRRSQARAPVVRRRLPRKTTVARRPAPRPVPVVAAEPRTITFLLTLLGLDSPQVDARTGAAMGI